MNNKQIYKPQQVVATVKQLCKQRNITQKELLIKCCLGPNTFSHMLHGKYIAYDSLAKIADCLECSVDYLLGRDTGNVTLPKFVTKYKALNPLGQKKADIYGVTRSCNELHRHYRSSFPKVRHRQLHSYEGA